jgi:uncharacterized cupredoxin-like copper-binding protein
VLLFLAGLATVAVVFLAASGCGGSSTGNRAEQVRVTERDFHISIAPNRVAAGDVRILAHNLGPDNHEMIVVRAKDPHLPLRADDVTVDEEGLKRVTVGVLEPGEPGSTRQLQVHLTPGRYELICNMAGHYAGGMHTALIVG